MSEKEVLEQAIQKAIDGGWKQFDGYKYKWVRLPIASLSCMIRFEDKFGNGVTINVETLIFNHDFAKALWGEHCIDAGGMHTGLGCIVSWKHRLQQMVVTDDPIKYLGENT